MRRGPGIIAALIVAVACLSWFHPAEAAGKRTITVVKSLVASADFGYMSADSCILSQVFVGGVNNVGAGLTTAFVNVFQYNFCAGSLFFGSSEVVVIDPTQFTIDANLNAATLRTTLLGQATVCGAGGCVQTNNLPIAIDVTWAATGSPTTSNSSVHYLAAGSLTNLIATGTSRTAVASGSVTAPGAQGNLTPEPSDTGELINATNNDILTTP